MNYFTELSVELANQKDYLDQLFSVYPLRPDSIRDVDPYLWKRIETSFNANNNKALFRALLDLQLFPVKDGYVPFFKHDPSAIDRNPNTVNRICGRVRELGIDKLYERITQPKETNRQMGPLFRRWIESGVLGLIPVSEHEFTRNQNNAILAGSDSFLQDYAARHLGYTRDKGLDFIGRFNGKYVIGEAKFISDEGGHQNDQFLDAMTTVATPLNENVIAVAILDGVLYIESKKKMYTTITSSDMRVFSALLLRDFLYQV